jgi:hypothetical protein
MSGKGSRQRPGQGYAEGWDAIFGKMEPSVSPQWESLTCEQLHDQVLEAFDRNIDIAKRTGGLGTPFLNMLAKQKQRKTDKED